MEMEFRAEKRAGALLTALLVAPALFAQANRAATEGSGPTEAAEPNGAAPFGRGSVFPFEVWHGHSRPPHVRKTANVGTLTIDATGVSFQETATAKGKPPKRPVSWRWRFDDIEQLQLAPKSLKVLTYKDVWWKAGADQGYDFDLLSKNTFEDAYAFLKARLDQRFVAAVAAPPGNVLWEIPVKRLVRFGGAQGVLRIGPADIVFESPTKDASRTWRYEDIDNVSTSGPFELTFVTYERSRLDYGSMKQFTFELKQRLDPARYDDLWLRLNQSKGLKVLNAYRNDATR
jgi:hypothetical protein